MTTSETLRQYPCQELVELVTEYLDGALSPSERASFEAHLSACVGCRTHVDQVRRTIGALGQLPAEPIPAESRQSLLDIFRQWKGGAS